jgi:hypothetical protein
MAAARRSFLASSSSIVPPSPSLLPSLPALKSFRGNFEGFIHHIYRPKVGKEEEMGSRKDLTNEELWNAMHPHQHHSL